MKKHKKTAKNYSIAKTPRELFSILGIDNEVDQALVLYKVQLSKLATSAIENSGLSINEIVLRSGVARSKVSAIKNGALAGISSDLFLKVITAAGAKITFRMAS